MNGFRLFAVALAVSVLAPAAHAADAPVTLTLATWGTPSHPHEKEFVQRFIDAAKGYSNGRLEFKYFPNGSMVQQGAVVTAVPADLVDIALMIVDSWAGIDNDVSITASPLWTLSMEDARKDLVPGNPIYEHFAGIFKRSNVQLLCLFDIGPPIVASTFPLRRPEDIKGRVVRALSKGTAEDLQALGASPIVMSVGQVYAALQRHTVDAAMNGIQGSMGLRYYEVAGYMMATGGVMGTIISGYVMNLDKFNALPPDLQAAITRAARETREHTQDALITSYPEYLKEAEAHNMKVFALDKDKPEWPAWQAALADFKKQSRSLYSPKIVGLLAP